MAPCTDTQAASPTDIRPGTTVTVFTQDEASYSPNDNDSADFLLEGDVIFTNEPDAVLIYKRDITDTAKFTPSFTTSFGFLMASYLSGPIIKGNEGVRVGDAMRQRAMSPAAVSAAASANASSTTVDFTPSSLSARA